MKKLFILSVLSLAMLQVRAQDHIVEITVDPTFNCGDYVNATGTYSTTSSTTIEHHTWDVFPCDADGNIEGEAIFSEDYPGAPTGAPFDIPGSESFECGKHYLLQLSVANTDGGLEGQGSAQFSLSSPPGCVSGLNQQTLTPGSGGGAQNNIISLIPGNYIYTLTSNGTSLANNIVTSFNGNFFAPNTVFPIFNSQTSFAYTFFLAANAPICTSQELIWKFFDMGGNLVCEHHFFVFCKSNLKQTLVNLSSGEYYQGDDRRLHRMYWANNTWNYQAINPWGGWGNVEMDGWLLGDPNFDRVFFKGTDGLLYNIYNYNGSWLLGALIGGISVKSNVQQRSGELIYIGTDDLIHRVYWGNNTWNHQLITPFGGYNGITASRALTLAPGTGSNIFFRSSTNAIINMYQLSGVWYMNTIPTVACNGDMIFDNSQYRIYFRGTDNKLHNTSWTLNTGWVYDAMTVAGQGLVSNNIAHNEGDLSVFYKGTDNRVYNIYQTANGWGIDWLNGSFTGVGGDLVPSVNAVFFINTGKQVSNYWFYGSPIWAVGPLNNAPTNAIGCSINFREAPAEDQIAAAPHTSANEPMEVFPNPGNGTFQVLLKEPVEAAKAELINATGQQVDAFRITGNSYSYSPSQSLSAGVYLLMIYTDSKVCSKRIVVE